MPNRYELARTLFLIGRVAHDGALSFKVRGSRPLLGRVQLSGQGSRLCHHGPLDATTLKIGKAAYTGGGSRINMDGVINSIVRDNLLYDNHASGISLYHIDAATGSTGDIVVNNTIVNAADGRWCVNINSDSTGNCSARRSYFPCRC